MNGRVAKSCFDRVVNSKIGSFGIINNNCLEYIQLLLELKTRPRFSPICLSLPQAPSIPLGPFQIFSKICGGIRSARFATGVNDTGGKWKKPSSWKILIILLLKRLDFQHCDTYINRKKLHSVSMILNYEHQIFIAPAIGENIKIDLSLSPMLENKVESLSLSLVF